MSSETVAFQNQRAGDLVSLFKGDSRCLHHRVVPSRAAQFEDFPLELSPDLVAALKGGGIHRLYSHQREAVSLALDGKNVVIVTPTASGKTLCYNLPVLNAVVKNPQAKALYLFPTKALANDQMDEIHGLAARLKTELRCFTFDGDTPQDARSAIRSRGQIVISNPDMLHQGILPHHTKWISFFENLQYVVIDEMHCYRGIFGSHLANVIRRLKRVCRFYRTEPRFILASATIANPSELACALTGESVELVSESGAPRGEKHYFFFNPPIVDEALGIRASALHLARSLARQAIGRDLQTIVFATSRLNVEVLVKYLKDDFEKNLQDRGKIRGYRGGYLPNARREIEKGLRDGRVRGVVSTNALELGIDIGGLDVSVLAGYPGTIAGTWQQSGRSGRTMMESVSILVARSHPLDQYIIQNPEYFFGASPENARVNPDNLSILVSHIKCAAFELPFKEGETFGSENLGEILNYLEEEKVVRFSSGQWHWMSDAYPADQVGLRSVNPENVIVFDLDELGKPIAEVDLPSAPFMVHPDAIYLLEQTPYVVEKLDMKEKKALVRKSDGTYYTEAIDSTNVRILDCFESAHCGATQPAHGEVHVLTHISGFKKIKFYTLENLGYGKVNLPDQEMHTTAYWFTVRPDVLARSGLGRTQTIDGLIGIAYALHTMAALFLMCDLRDIHRCIGDRQAKWFVSQTFEGRGAYTTAVDDQQNPVSLDLLDCFEPTIFIYENVAGGVGFSPLLFEQHETLLANVFRLIQNCACPHGCPSCVGPIVESGRRSKPYAIGILNVIGSVKSI